MQPSRFTTSSTDVSTPPFEWDDDGRRIGLLVVPMEVHPPAEQSMGGRYVTLKPLDVRAHAAALWSAYRGFDELWTYMPHGPFAGESDYGEWIETVQHRSDPLFFAITDRVSGQAQGVASYLRIDTQARSIEVGWITLAPVLQGTRGSTEAMYLMMRTAFDLGFRRYEWKCNALNDPSIRAARRLGMTYEGTFRQATVVKGRNRDTAWFSLLDTEWPSARREFERWLEPGNFDAAGRQLTPLQVESGHGREAPPPQFHP